MSRNKKAERKIPHHELIPQVPIPTDICPPPKDMDFLPESKLQRPFKRNGTEFGLEGCSRGTYGGVKLEDPDELAKQKAVVKHLLKTLGNNLMEGRSAVNISLPVHIFEPRSFLQRITDVWSYAPLYLTKAANAKDPVERLKYVVTFLLSGLHRGTKQKKPFNPILGETFQSRYIDGSQIFAEQVSHHPPVSSFQVIGPNGLWHFHGCHEYKANFRPNGVIGGQVGPNIVDFKDGGRITFDIPHCRISGAVMGERTFNYQDTLVFLDPVNALRCEVTLNPDALSGLKAWVSTAATPSDTLRGSVFQGNKEISKLEGSWLDGFSFDGKPYWKFGECQPFEPLCLKDEEVLPSDCRFRPDLRALLTKDMDVAQAEKEKLENIQREDRKLRQAVHGLASPLSASSSEGSKPKKGWW